MRRALLCFIFLALGVEAAFDASGRAVLLRPALLPPPPRGGRHALVKRAAASPQCMMSPWPTTNQQQQRKSAAATAAAARSSTLRSALDAPSLPGDVAQPEEEAFAYAAEIAAGAPCLAPTLAAVQEDKEVLALLRECSEVLVEATSYLRPSGQQLVRLALEVAVLAHHGQHRRSGEPFVSHPVAVAGILASSNMEKETVVSGLLHDTVEDTELTFEELEALFGFVVRRIVEGETKVSKLPKMVRSQMADEGVATLDANFLQPGGGVAAGGEGGSGGGGGGGGPNSASKVEEQVENMRSMFIAMADDWRIVVVKLADRLHNMRTLQHMPIEKRASIARETLEIFAPLAHRLGMWQFKTELSDLSFKYLFPTEYDDLDKQISAKFFECQTVLSEARSQMEELLHTDPWLQGRLRSVQVVGRTKSIYSTFKKMERHECGIEKIHDLIALRVVLNPEASNSHAAAQSSSSSASSSSSQFSSSSQSSSGSSEGGDEGGSGSSSSSSSSSAAEGENALCYHVLGKVHSQYTPLPRTLKDYISSPKPNGYRSLHTTVLVGTQPLEVQIRTQAMHAIAEYGAAAHWAYKDRAASLPWLQIIREWQDNVDSAHEFMQLVRQELLGTRVFVFTRNGRILNLAKGATLLDAAKHLNLPDRGYVPMLNGKAALHTQALQNGDIVSFERSSSVLLDRIAEAEVEEQQQQEQQEEGGEQAGGDGSGSSRSSRSSGEGDESRASAIGRMSIKQRAQQYLEKRGPKAPPPNARKGRARWCPCSDCLPLPGDTLLGASLDPPDEAKGGTVHCDPNCRTLQGQLEGGFHLLPGETDKEAATFKEAIEAQCERDNGLSASIIVFCTDRRGMLIDVATAVTAGVDNIINVHSDVFEAGGKSAFKYEVMVKDRMQLEALIESVASVPDVTKVMRGKHYK